MNLTACSPFYACLVNSSFSYFHRRRVSAKSGKSGKSKGILFFLEKSGTVEKSQGKVGDRFGKFQKFRISRGLDTNKRVKKVY